jgi:hypothetical protein
LGVDKGTVGKFDAVMSQRKMRSTRPFGGLKLASVEVSPPGDTQKRIQIKPLALDP